jgi:hypothetical protein
VLNVSISVFLPYFPSLPPAMSATNYISLDCIHHHHISDMLAATSSFPAGRPGMNESLSGGRTPFNAPGPAPPANVRREVLVHRHERQEPRPAARRRPHCPAPPPHLPAPSHNISRQRMPSHRHYRVLRAASPAGHVATCQHLIQQSRIRRC